MKKLLIKILPIVIVGLVVFLGYYIFSQTRPTSGDVSTWKTFTNQSITFKYPKNWNTRELSGSDVRLRSSDYPKNSSEKILTKGTEVLFILSGKVEFDGTKPLADVVRGIETALTQADSFQAVVLNGQEVVRVDTHGGIIKAKDFVETSYYIGYNNKLYIIKRLYPSGEQGKYEDIFQKILNNIQLL